MRLSHGLLFRCRWKLRPKLLYRHIPSIPASGKSAFGISSSVVIFGVSGFSCHPTICVCKEYVIHMTQKPDNYSCCSRRFS